MSREHGLENCTYLYFACNTTPSSTSLLLPQHRATRIPIFTFSVKVPHHPGPHGGLPSPWAQSPFLASAGITLHWCPNSRRVRSGSICICTPRPARSPTPESRPSELLMNAQMNQVALSGGSPGHSLLYGACSPVAAAPAVSPAEAQDTARGPAGARAKRPGPRRQRPACPRATWRTR